MFEIGTKVRFAETTDARLLHADQPKFYPPPGTIGTVIGQPVNWKRSSLIQWPEESGTAYGHQWYCPAQYLTEVTDDAAK